MACFVLMGDVGRVVMAEIHGFDIIKRNYAFKIFNVKLEN